MQNMQCITVVLAWGLHVGGGGRSPVLFGHAPLPLCDAGRVAPVPKEAAAWQLHGTSAAKAKLQERLAANEEVICFPSGPLGTLPESGARVLENVHDGKAAQCAAALEVLHHAPLHAHFALNQ